MNIIAVDDERRALGTLERALKQAAPDATVACFSAAESTLNHARAHRVDVAFLDITMGGTNGLLLAKYLKDISPNTNIVFVTGYSQYATDAFELHASGYVMKPVSPAHIRTELDNLRVPAAPPTARVRVQCFGSFAVFVDGKPLLFPRAKPRELLAYLVHKQGAAVTNADIASVLWEDSAATRSIQSNTRNVIAQLNAHLDEAGIAGIVLRARNSTAIDVPAISCDYYDYLRGNAQAVNAYAGEYLSDYSWAEFTVARLNNQM